METDRPLSITATQTVSVNRSDSPQKQSFPKLMVKQESVYWGFSWGEILELGVQHKDGKGVLM